LEVIRLFSNTLEEGIGGGEYGKMTKYDIWKNALLL
jgi:hypothetical protein